MKKLILLSLCFLSLSGKVIFAQEEEEVGLLSKFGFGGGFNAVWLMPNLDDLNKMMPAAGVENFSKSGFMSWGGSGYIYIMAIENLRIGGIGISGTTSRTGAKDGFNKEVEYSMGLGGVTLEYTLPFVEKIGISVGGIIGVGSSTINIYQNKGELNWGDIWNEVSDPAQKTQNISRKLKNTFFTVAPTLNIDIPISRFASFRIGAGYIVSFSDNWKGDNDLKLNGVPSSLKGNTFFLQTGIFIGFISY
jgi:hypothetical protein